MKCIKQQMQGGLLVYFHLWLASTLLKVTEAQKLNNKWTISTLPPPRLPGSSVWDTPNFQIPTQLQRKLSLLPAQCSTSDSSVFIWSRYTVYGVCEPSNILQHRCEYLAFDLFSSFVWQYRPVPGGEGGGAWGAWSNPLNHDNTPRFVLHTCNTV